MLRLCSAGVFELFHEHLAALTVCNAAGIRIWDCRIEVTAAARQPDWAQLAGTAMVVTKKFIQVPAVVCWLSAQAVNPESAERS
mmetsp:Transcript_7677/g.11936  ORF Transcript_7677/g.11936 Transcript_7677/m.11936 type:complete len:84 (-) Transcript_7677:293-544(-)